ncbi:MAG: phytoene desaturase [Planctomycetota bacterium]
MTKTSNPSKIVIVGAGPGGLTAAMLLAHRGLDVTVYEKQPYVGGRNSHFKLGPYKFDLGPTFLMMKFLLDEVFHEAGRNIEDYMQFVQLEPFYRLTFKNQSLFTWTDREKMRSEIERCFPGQGSRLDQFHRVERKRFDAMLPCLQKDYSNVTSLVSPDLIKAMPRLSMGRSVFSVLGDYFNPVDLRLAFTFQAKYLGMSAWECPGAFAILSYIEHAFGVFHTIGGLSSISEGMAKAAEDNGAKIVLSTPVKQVLVDGRRTTGVLLENGERIPADAVIINADFAHAMANLFPPNSLRKYTKSNIERRRYSCSTFMLYLGLDKLYDAPHHEIVFAEDYESNVADIFKHERLSKDISFYVRNASITDPTLAPEGHSAVYVLVPVPNLKAGIDWAKEAPAFRELVLESIERRTPFKDLRKHIVEEKVITPLNWRDDYDVYFGATFNLAHTLGQMLYFRPRNRFEEFRSCYLVGGGTHPGSGVPTIVESGRISANLLCRDLRIPFESFNVKV